MRRDLEIEFQRLKIEKLEVHPKVQRALNRKHVERIARNWHPVAVNPPTVLRMTSGKRAYYIIDGQHTVAAAKLVGLKFIDCKMVGAKTREEMNEIFQLINGGVMRVSPLDSYRLNAENDYRTDDYKIRSVLQEFDLRVEEGNSVRSIASIVPLQHAYKALGIDRFANLAGLLGIVADGGSRVDRATILALADLARKYTSDVDLRELGEELAVNFPNIRDEATAKCIGSTLANNSKMFAEHIEIAAFGAGALYSAA